MSIAVPLDIAPFTNLVQFTIIGQGKIETAYEQDSFSPAIKQQIDDFYAGRADYPDGAIGQSYRELRRNSKFTMLFNKAKNEANRAGLLAIYFPKLERLQTAFESYCDLLLNNFQNLYTPFPDEDEQIKDWTESLRELNAAIVDLQKAVPTQPSSAQLAPEQPKGDKFQLAVEAAQEQLEQAEHGFRNAVAKANAILQLFGVPDVNYVDKSGQRVPNTSPPEPWKYVEELDSTAHKAYCEYINAESERDGAKKNLEAAREALANRIVTLANFVGCVRLNETLSKRATEEHRRDNTSESRFLTRAPKFHFTQYEADEAATRYRASPYCATLETIVLAAGKPWQAESIKQLAAQAARSRGETVDQFLALELGEAVKIFANKTEGANTAGGTEPKTSSGPK